MLGAMTQPHSYMIAGPAGELAVHDWVPDDPDVRRSPVLLAHPTGFHGLVWAPVADLLVAAGRHVWSFDFRGHGDSDAPDPESGAYSWDGFASDALAVAALPFASRFRWPHLPAANRDHKTRLPFYAWFDLLARLFASLPSLAASETELGFIDLAGFRAFNNAHGQDAGDSVLAAFAGELARIEAAAAIRDGGDEFLVVGAPSRPPLAPDLEAFLVSWKAAFHACFGADVPGVAPRIVVGHSTGAELRALRQRLGRAITRLKDLATIPDIGVLVSAVYGDTEVRSDAVQEFSLNPDSPGEFDANGDGEISEDESDLLGLCCTSFGTRIQTKKRSAVTAALEWKPTDTVHLTLDGLFTRLDAPTVGYHESYYVEDSILDDIGTHRWSDVTIRDHWVTDMTVAELVPELSTITEHRVVDTAQFGWNAVWQATEQLSFNFDAYRSKSDRDSGGKDTWVVSGIAGSHVGHVHMNNNGLPDISVTLEDGRDYATALQNGELVVPDQLARSTNHG